MTRSTIWVTLALCGGCMVGEPGTSSPTVDQDPTGSIPAPTATMTGRVVDDFSGAALPSALLDTLGLEVEQRAFTGDQGTYMLAELPETSVFFLHAAKENYRDTLDDGASVDSQRVVHDVHMISRGDAERQHSTMGVQMRDDAALVVLDLQDADGAPLAGLPRSSLSLVDAAGASVANPVLFGALGDVDPAVTSTIVVAGRARAALLNVPEGFYDLVVTCDVCSPATTLHRSVAARAGGVTLATVALAGSTQAPTASFSDVYRILQRGSDGGAGCANCHNAGGPAATLVFDASADDVHVALRAGSGLLDLAHPASSLLLTKPLYEVPANHPNATWLDTNQRDYQTMLRWIQAGAAR